MAEDAGGEDRNADIGAGAARDVHHVAAEGELGDVEIGAREGAEEHLLVRGRDELGRAAGDGDAAIEDAARAVVVAAGYRQTIGHGLSVMSGGDRRQEQ
jgi:hypothetical protein